jgi:hypothetical protein
MVASVHPETPYFEAVSPISVRANPDELCICAVQASDFNLLARFTSFRAQCSHG